MNLVLKNYLKYYKQERYRLTVTQFILAIVIFAMSAPNILLEHCIFMDCRISMYMNDVEYIKMHIFVATFFANSSCEDCQNKLVLQ